MEYNNNTYVTISHENCEALNLGDSHRMSNDRMTCIIVFLEGQIIPEEIQSVMLATYTHQEALELVEQPEWVQEMPM